MRLKAFALLLFKRSYQLFVELPRASARGM